MNILITGSRAFLAKHLIAYLSKNHLIYATTRETLNPLIKEQVESFFKDYQIDVVIHAAITGGSRLFADDYSVFYNNMLMFQNLVTFSKNIKLFINLGSGAEFDRRYEIDRKKEKEVFQCVPTEFYGLSKNLMTRMIYNMPSAVNLRLFNAFAANEREKRFITTVLSNDPVTVLDGYMDFFYIDDFCKIVEWCIDNIPLPFSDINCVYLEKYKLVEIDEIAQNITGQRHTTIVDNKKLSYTGNGDLLSTLPIKFMGLIKGMEETFRKSK